MTPPISVVMICRNESACIADALASVADAEEIVVMDTGSQDQTLLVLGALTHRFPQLRVFEGEWHDHFARARNEALSYATHDWRLILDADETLDPGSMPILRAALGTATGRTMRVHARAASGTARHRSIRAFRRGVQYVGAIHEVPDADDGEACEAEVIYGCSPAHDLDPARSLRILLAEHARDPGDTRIVYYLAREHFYRRSDPDHAAAALALFTRHTATSPHLAERADAWLYLARLHWSAGRGDAARTACLHALAVNANFSEALRFMAELSFRANAAAWIRYATAATDEAVLFVR